MVVAGDIELGEGGINHYAYYAKSTLFDGLPTDTVFTIDQLISDTEWRRSAFYLLFCEPHNCYHMLGADIRMPDGGIVRFRINRPFDHPRRDDADFRRSLIGTVQEQKLAFDGLRKHYCGLQLPGTDQGQ